MSRTRRKSPSSSLPVVNGRRLTAVQASRLKAADRAEQRGDPVMARRLRLGVEQDLAAAETAAWRSGVIVEATDLERRRGVTVQASPGRVRIDGRDGLAGLKASGSLSERQAAAGMLYRRRFEAAQHRLGSAMELRQGGGGGGRGDVPEAVALRIAAANRDLARLEAAVRERYAAEGRAALAGDALLALREVAGLGRAIRELASSGARRAAFRDRLAEALDTVAGARL